MHKRTCGECQLCCRLLPVRDIAKPAATKCQHQKHGTGCVIYATRPRSCRIWSCGWLTDEATATLSRPDRAHYVIDPSPDFIEIEDNETGERTPIPVLQIWCDPKHPDAHRDPALRAVLDANQTISIIRYNALDGFILFPPSTNSDGRWHEEQSAMRTAGHSAEEIVRALAQQERP